MRRLRAERHRDRPEGAHPFPGTIETLRAIDARARPELKRAVPAAVISIVTFAIGNQLGGVGRRTPARFALGGHTLDVSAGQAALVVAGLAVVFLVSGVVAVRAVGIELARVASARGSVEAGTSLRLLVLVVGYGLLGLGLLGLMRVDLGNLLVGGAVTGIITGIAAQQTLGNVFAGMVLLVSRPYVPGQRVVVRSGSLGGPFEGVITAGGLMYTTIETDEGVISLPNSGLLAAAIGPAPVRTDQDPVVR